MIAFVPLSGKKYPILGALAHGLINRGTGFIRENTVIVVNYYDSEFGASPRHDRPEFEKGIVKYQEIASKSKGKGFLPRSQAPV